MAGITFSDKTVNPEIIPSGQSLTAYKGVSVSDTNTLSSTQTVTIKLSQSLSQSSGLNYNFYPTAPDFGSIRDPNGGGSFDPATETFTESGVVGGDPTFATNLLSRLLYKAPQLPNGQGFATQANITVSDGPLSVTDSSPVIVGVVTPPAIGGTVANQPIASGDKISPFATVNVTNPYFGYGYHTVTGVYPNQIDTSGLSGSYNSTDTATIIITDGGTPTDADGLLTGPGLSKTGVGTYTLPVQQSYYRYYNTFNLQALSFATHPLAAGQTINPHFELDVTDTTTNLGSKDTTTSLLVIGPTLVPAAPHIAGTEAGQTVSPGRVINPFAGVTVSDTNPTPTVSASITVTDGSGKTSDANGTLTGTGLTETASGSGVYTLVAVSPLALTTVLKALTFHPAGVTSETVGFAISVSDPTFAVPTMDTKTTAIVGAISSPPPPPSSDSVTLRGSSSEYSIANNNGSLFIQDHVSGRDVTQTTSATKINFTDGTGVFDPTGTGEDVSRIYTAALGRLPDKGGLVFWTSQVDGSHVPLNHIAANFTTSPEFIQHYGALSNALFVNQLYQNVLGRPGEAAGVQSWENTLAAGTSRGTVVESFAQSPENRAKTLSTAGDKNDAEATRVYAAAFNRAPDAGGEAFWSGQLANGATPTQIAQGFVSSPEFQGIYGKLTVSDFVSQLYQNVLHRAGDAAGQQFWTSTLQQGASEASVLVGFSDGLENRVQTAKATHDGWVFIPS